MEGLLETLSTVVSQAEQQLRTPGSEMSLSAPRIKRLYNHAHIAAASLPYQHCHYHKQSTNTCDFLLSTRSWSESACRKCLCEFRGCKRSVTDCPRSSFRKILKGIGCIFNNNCAPRVYKMLPEISLCVALCPHSPLTCLHTHLRSCSLTHSSLFRIRQKWSLTLHTLQARSTVDLISWAPLVNGSCVFWLFLLPCHRWQSRKGHASVGL